MPAPPLPRPTRVPAVVGTLLSTVGFACAVAAPLAELAGLDPIPDLDRTPVRAAGLALLVPNLVAAVMLVAFLTALQIQVRLVEEPYLHRMHGPAWEQYATRTGRFLPWIGRLGPGIGPA